MIETAYLRIKEVLYSETCVFYTLDAKLKQIVMIEFLQKRGNLSRWVKKFRGGGANIKYKLSSVLPSTAAAENDQLHADKLNTRKPSYCS